MSQLIAKADQASTDRIDASTEHARRYRADRFGISAEELEAIVQRARPLEDESRELSEDDR